VFFNKRLGKLAKRVFFTSLNCNKFELNPFPQHDPLTHKRLFHNLILGGAGEYSQTIRTLTPFSPTPTSSNTTSTFIALHLKSNGYFSFYLKNYEPDQDL
jgi:hypothetical protein